jgi:alkanesulfonate monooxygenase SsuD/methylene tetrahydromethanopterin reductase-like flavin-dependent oxidoreductase (luciferase family)
MKVNVSLASHNSADWARVASGAFDRPAEIPDFDCVEEMLALGDLVEPLGFDGIWVTDHCATPFGMTPNPLQLLTWFAARTEQVALGTMVVVAPWWNPVRLAHQIAYLDILSKGRYDTIGLGRGVSKVEFDAVGVPRDESRQRLDETLDILKLALSQERFAYEGQIFKVPEMAIRPQPRSPDLVSRLYGGSSTGPSLEANARRGLRPLFVGNKPVSEAGQEVLQVNRVRREIGLPPCQPKNVLFLHCAATPEDAARSQGFVDASNRDVGLHYGFADPANFAGIKGYEAYAARTAAATAPVAAAVTGDPAAKATPAGYDSSNLLLGTPDQVIERIVAVQRATSFSEMTVIPLFGDMDLAAAEKSLRLFAKEVLPVVHRMDAPLHPSVVPQPEATGA